MFCKIIKKEFITQQQAEDVYDISVEKYHNFILANGAVVHNCDTFQSAQIRQQLEADNFNVSVISVDRLDSETKTQLQYAYLKSTIYDRRLKVYSKCDFLTEEVLGLERLSDGHIEHPNAGRSGSKDAIDSVCGAMWNASLHADEFAFEYGEELAAVVQASGSNNPFDKKQIMLDFEEELKKVSNDPLRNYSAEQTKQDESQFMNFGMGRAQVLQAQYLPEGIIVF